MNEKDREWCRSFFGQPESTTNHLLSHIAIELDRIANSLERMSGQSMDQTIETITIHAKGPIV